MLAPSFTGFGTLLPIEDVCAMVAIEGKADKICSI
jgi:hypothetical protein